MGRRAAEGWAKQPNSYVIQACDPLVQRSGACMRHERTGNIQVYVGEDRRNKGMPGYFRIRSIARPRQITTKSSSYPMLSKAILRRLSWSSSIQLVPIPPFSYPPFRLWNTKLLLVLAFGQVKPQDLPLTEKDLGRTRQNKRRQHPAGS